MTQLSTSLPYLPAGQPVFMAVAEIQGQKQKYASAVSSLLLSHWLKQMTLPSPESVQKGATKGHDTGRLKKLGPDENVDSISL